MAIGMVMECSGDAFVATKTTKPNLKEYNEMGLRRTYTDSE
jgi:hypothetical protein